MELDVGTVVAAIAAVLFYLRLIRAQRALLKHPSASAVPRLIRRGTVFGVGLVLVVAGAFVAAGVLPGGLGAGARPWWWLPVAFGFAVLTLSI